jgi:hypothetical protein
MYQFGISFGTKCSLPANYSKLIEIYVHQNQKNVKCPLISQSYHNLATIEVNHNINAPMLMLRSIFVLVNKALFVKLNRLIKDLLEERSRNKKIITFTHYFFLILGNL